MRGLVDTGLSVVVVTLGERGVLTVTQEDTFWVQVPKVQVVNPIASGDIFLGGFAVKYLEMQNIELAVQFGTTCAVANVMNLTPELPQDVDLQELLKNVRVVRDEIYRY
jgi:fructose-1-phosphate kinase PfkB-like protein